MRKAALTGLIALVLGAGFCLIVLARHDWDPMAFVSVGTRFADKDPAGTTGYDGQFTFYIATQGRQARIEQTLQVSRGIPVGQHQQSV